MKIKSCMTNHLENPLGFSMEYVVLSWISESEISKFQETAQVIVAKDEEMMDICFDTGRQSGLSNLGVEVPIQLTLYTRYYWIVTVWGDKGDVCTSQVNWFETGKGNDKWEGVFITPPWEDKNIHPYIRKEINLDQPVKQARIYISALGLYHLEINGCKVGEEYLTPYCTTVDSWLQYHTFDITYMLKQGSNAVGAILGNGWAKGKFGTFGDKNIPYANEFMLIAEIRITLENGEQVVIGTDTDWLCAPSPVLESSIYDGEIYDATAEIYNWSKEGLDVSDWCKTEVARTENIGELQERLSPLVVVKEFVEPSELIETPNGELVLDMGQNMAGWLRFAIDEPKGTKIKISYGEILQDGNFYRENLRRAKAEYIYIADGTKREVEPHFTYYGFRYAKLEGFTKTIQLCDFKGCVVYSDMKETGFIVTSDPRINRLYENTKWSQKGNFLDVPTDCPQRDERMGWTGDAQVFCRTASFHMDTYAFYTKFMNDLWQEQEKLDGMVGNVVPSFVKDREIVAGAASGGAAAWGDSATIIPWTLYQHYGDKTILKRQYKSMKAWVDWISKQIEESNGTYLWNTGFQWGDWLALDGPVKGGTKGGTEDTLIASAFYKHSAELVSKAAQVLGHEKDAIYYQELADRIKQEIQAEYYTQNGRCAIQTQTAHVLGIIFDLVSEDGKKKLAKELVRLIQHNNKHLTTGFVGTPYLCLALSQCGEAETAYQLLFQTDYPSWLYEVNLGATTIWERWNSVLPDGKISGTGMNSLNHYAYGTIAEWLYSHMCGIGQIESEPGFKKFAICPEYYGKLKGAKAVYESAMGKIECGWIREKSGLTRLKVKIPFDTTASLILTDTSIEKMEGVDKKLAIEEGKNVKVELTPGTYDISFLCEKHYGAGYNFAMSLNELCQNSESAKIVGQLMNMLNRIPEDMRPDFSLSVNDMLGSLSPSILAAVKQMIDFEDIERQLEEITESNEEIDFDL